MSSLEQNTIPPQHQHTQPGLTTPMEPKPQDTMEAYKGSGMFTEKCVIVTGGDSGIGRATAIGFAKEGADVAIVYLKEHKDAEVTKAHVEAQGRRALLIPADVGNEAQCIEVVQKVKDTFNHIHVLCNNAAEQHPQKSISDITTQQLEQTFSTNMYSMFHMVKACLPYLKQGASIVNTASVTAYAGSPHLLDYSSTKGAIVSFTRSLSLNLVEQGIRVNAVAPGPIWTPLIPSTFPPDKVASFGKDTPMKRPGQPDEVAPAILFLASEYASYITGQTIHMNGGEMLTV